MYFTDMRNFCVNFNYSFTQTSNLFFKPHVLQDCLFLLLLKYQTKRFPFYGHSWTFFDLELIFFCCYSATFSFYRESSRKLFIIDQTVCYKFENLVAYIDLAFSLNVIIHKLIWISVNSKYDKKSNIFIVNCHKVIEISNKNWGK